MNYLPYEIIENINTFNDLKSKLLFTTSNKFINNVLRKQLIIRKILQIAYQTGIHDGYLAKSSLDIVGYNLDNKPSILDSSYISWKKLEDLNKKLFLY